MTAVDIRSAFEVTIIFPLDESLRDKLRSQKDSMKQGARTSIQWVGELEVYLLAFRLFGEVTLKKTLKMR